MQIPNLALVAVSQSGFSEKTIYFAQTTTLSPWYGGEAGQILLVDTLTRQVFAHSGIGIRDFPWRGILPLMHATRLLQATCQRTL